MRRKITHPLSLGLLVTAMLASSPVPAVPSATVAQSSLPADSDSGNGVDPDFVDVDGRPPSGQELAGRPPSSLRIAFEAIESIDARLALGLDAALPTSLAAGDLDADGMPDLLCGYADAATGFVTVHRGNVDSVFPFAPTARQRRATGSSPTPFFSPDGSFEVPVRPDFLVVGDFDNDGHQDLLTAARGGDALYVLGGDGRGGVRTAEAYAVGGAITGLVAGDLNRRDGSIDLVLAISGNAGPHLLVYESPDGALAAEPEVLELPAAVVELALGQVVGDLATDIVMTTGSELIVVEGRDRRLASTQARRATADRARVRHGRLDQPAQAIALGQFVREGKDRSQIALLVPGRSVIVLGLEQSEATETLSWSVLAERALPPAPLGSEVRLQSARVAPGATEDLILVDRAGLRLMPRSSSEPAVPDLGPAGGKPLVVLPMRLNEDAFQDLVVLQESGEITVLRSTIQATITVDSAADIALANDGFCTLREAIANANGNTDTTLGDCVAGAGNDSIAFNIAGGGSPATIALSSALPPVSDAVVINGNTQGCSAPPCIELAGGATVGADGLSLVGGNSTVRGLVINDFDVDGIPVGSGGNFIEGNFIGLDLSGAVAVPNGSDGIDVNTTAPSNTIGGTVAAARNVVSGNLSDGIEIAPGPGTLVLGNYIGTDVGGTVDLGNGFSGVVVGGTSSCVIGGTAVGTGNLIGGNAQSGVTFAFGTSANLVQGNRIGTDLTGSLALGNDINGVLVRDSTGITIGGTAAGARNIISANGGDGVQVDIDTGASTDNAILGNYIGTDITGGTALGNADDGIEIENSTENSVGGTTSSARNLISGNLRGVLLDDPQSRGNEILGNYIGTDLDGLGALPNLDYGVAAFDGAFDNAIGGTETGAGNLISGNAIDGVRISEPSDGNRIQGNLIGVDATGTTALANGSDGIQVNNIVVNTTIGGLAPGAGNVIAGNGRFGVFLVGGPSASQVLGNLVGTDINGTSALPNAMSGVLVQDAASNTIGGASAAARNVISGNGENGVFLASLAGLASSNQVLGNFIGTDISGTTALPNLLSGIEVRDASNNTIGGTAPGTGNLIAAAFGRGLWFHTPLGVAPPSNNLVQGNFIGTDVTGTIPLGTLLAGVLIRGGSNNTIGGTAAGAGNVIGGSTTHGILLDQGTFNNTIQGNFVGIGTGGAALGNSMDGVRIVNGSSRNTFGGTAPGAGNVIAGNDEAGIAVLDTSDRNTFLGNSVFSNGALGIDLGDDGITPNDADDSDSGANGLQNHPVLTSAIATVTDVTIVGDLTSTANRNFRVEFFAGAACDPSGSGEGERFLGFADVLTDGTGQASLNAVLSSGVGDGEAITATATQTNAATSEFAACVDASCASTIAFSQTIVAQDADTLAWSSPADLRYARGDLGAVSTYATNAGGLLTGAMTLDMSGDQPGPGSGSYYLVRPLGCGSWQTSPGAEPARDALLR